MLLPIVIIFIIIVIITIIIITIVIIFIITVIIISILSLSLLLLERVQYHINEKYLEYDEKHYTQCKKWYDVITFLLKKRKFL